MARIEDVMTPYPKTVDANTSVAEAAEIMRDADVGDVIVLSGGSACGILTDRDITVRVVAAGLDPEKTRVGDVCSEDVATLSPDDDVDTAIRLMREHAVRRLPVTVDSQPIGIVSLGDLSIEADGERALSDISAAPANR
ncbi:MAG TPA: CBS domain-containing protein [Acidimicrobiales bacterium]|nr:CBS domain-containing protein [Acidimicrobiales bacterium]